MKLDLGGSVRPLVSFWDTLREGITPRLRDSIIGHSLRDSLMGGLISISGRSLRDNLWGILRRRSLRRRR